MLTLPNFAHIQFDKPTHTYAANGKPLTGVTTLISELKQPFDAEPNAIRVAERRGVSKEAILKEWEEKRVRGQQRGSRVHNYIQSALGGANDETPDPLLIQTKLPEETAFDEWLQHVQKHNLLSDPICLEYIIGDEELGVAGTVDAVFPTPDGSRLFLYDWKTGGEFNAYSRFRKKLLPPFSDLDDCELNYYSLQLCLYSLILRRAGVTTLAPQAYIVHLSQEGTFTSHRTLDLMDRLNAWVKGRAQ